MPGRHAAPTALPRKTSRVSGLGAIIAGLVLLPTVAVAAPTLAPSPSPSPSASTGPTVGGKDAALVLDDLTVRAEAVQEEFIAASTRYEQAKAAAAQARGVAAQRQAQADKELAVAEEKKAVLGVWVRSMYQQGPMSGNPMAMALLSKSSNPSDFVNGLGVQEQVAKHRSGELNEATEAAAKAKKIADEAQQLRENADASEARAAKILTDIQQKAAAISSELSSILAEVGSQLAVANAEQQARNEKALKEWQTYLSSLAAAKVVNPTAAALANPAKLPQGMTPVLGKDKQPIPGIASVAFQGKPLTILPNETINAVSSAFSALGRPYAPKTSGPETFDCAGLVAASWRVARPVFSEALNEQFQNSRSVPGDQMFIGDLVFQADPKAGLHNVGIYVGGGMMINGSAITNMVSVMPVNETPALVTRLTLPSPTVTNVLPKAAGGLKMTCGQIEVPRVIQAVGKAGKGGPRNYSGSAAWGGFPNGMIPVNLLCETKSAPGQRLRCDAAQAMDNMSAAYAVTFKSPICITDSYRSYPAQVDVYARKPHLAAIPGTSNHGWALAVDLCGGIQTFGTPQHLWMVANAPRFGFEHPEWARSNGSKPEAWHWEFGNIS